MADPVLFAEGAVTEYSSVCPFSCDGKRILLIGGERKDHFVLYDVVPAGAPGKDLPAVSASSEPRWSATDPSIFYFHDGDGDNSNELRTMNVDTGKVRLHHTFRYAIKFGLGEGDVTPDGSCIPIVDGTFNADDQFLPLRVYLFNLLTLSQGPPLMLAGNPIDSVYVTAKNEMVVAWKTKGPGPFHGIEKFSADLQTRQQLVTANGHHCMVNDGHEDFLLWFNADDDSPKENAPNAVMKVAMDGKQTTLLALGWYGPQGKLSSTVHIAAPKVPTDWCTVEAYESPDAPPTPWGGQLVKVFLDPAIPPVSLCRHGSIVTDYSMQPRVTISRKPDANGDYLIAFTSNRSGKLATYLLRLPNAEVLVAGPVMLAGHLGGHTPGRPRRTQA